jgi:hypothetical protein
MDTSGSIAAEHHWRLRRCAEMVAASTIVADVVGLAPHTARSKPVDTL